MGTTFWLLGNNKELYAHMTRGPLSCVGALVFSRIAFSYHLPVQTKQISKQEDYQYNHEAILGLFLYQIL